MMRAVAVFPKGREVRLIDAPEPRIESPTEVKTRILEVGICGTDHEIINMTHGAPPPGEHYLILGHESLGEVVEVGDKVTQTRPGDLVVWRVRRPCPHPDCYACRSGRPDFCYTGDYTERGIKERHGFMADYVVDDQEWLHVAAPEMRAVAVLTEPTTIVEKSLNEVRILQQRLPWACRHTGFRDNTFIESTEGYCHRAVVLGAGPVGLLGAMALVIAGFQTHVYSLEEEDSPKAEAARAIGAQYTSAKQEEMAAFAASVGNIDLVYEATGASSLAFQMVEHLGTNGVFILTGVPGRRGTHEIKTDQIMLNMVLRNQLIVGSVNAGPPAFENAIRDLKIALERWPEATHGIITDRHPIEDFETPLLGKPSGIKHVIEVYGAV